MKVTYVIQTCAYVEREVPDELFSAALRGDVEAERKLKELGEELCIEENEEVISCDSNDIVDEYVCF